jgi:hypothetical protein
MMPINRGTRVKNSSVAAPMGGLNGRDGIATMQATDAIVLENMIPQPDGVVLRNGSQDHVTGFANKIQSLMSYKSALVNKLFAASGTSIYDVTTAGAVGAPVVSSISTPRFQTINFGTAAGQFLYCVNGVDTPKLYNGSNWQNVDTGTGATISTLTAVGSVCTVVTSTSDNLTTGQYIIMAGCTPSAYNGTYQITVTNSTTFTYTAGSPPGTCTIIGTYSDQIAITGVDSKSFISVSSYGSRLWFVEANSCRVWYLPAASVGGAATSIDFSSLFRLGGYLQGMVTWSIDNANGLNEYAVMVSSMGECVVYSGQDPASASTWGLKAHFRMGKPIGRRFYMKVGSDVHLITDDGISPLHQSLLTDRSQKNIEISDKISNLISNDILTYSSNFGWQSVLYPEGNKIIVNVPVIEGITSYQYVMNTITNGWSKFTGWNANCFETFNGKLFYGADTAVIACDIGASDNNTSILGKAIQAFSYFGDSLLKQFTLVRPLFTSDGKPSITVSMNVNYDVSPPNHVPSSVSFSGQPTWDSIYWDSIGWASPSSMHYSWYSVSSLGTSGAISMYVLANGTSVKWVSTDYQYISGGEI